MKPSLSADSSSFSFPMRRLPAVVLILVALSSSLPRVAVHSFALVAPPSTTRLQPQQRHYKSMSLALFPLFSSFASDSNTDTADRLLTERSLDEQDEHHDDQEEHHAGDANVVPKHISNMPAGVEPHIQVIESHVELQEFLAEDDRLCMIKFHAAWCKSCKRFGLHFNKLVSQKGDWIDHKTHDIVHHGQVRVASIEWTACTALCRSMGITRLPTVQFFYSGKKVGGLVAGPTKFVQVQQALDHYLSLQSSELDFEADMERGKTLMENEAGSIFKNQQAPKATSKQVVFMSSSEKVAAATRALVTAANNSNKTAHDDDDQSRRRTSWWNIKGVLAKRRARRDAALRDARP